MLRSFLYTIFFFFVACPIFYSQVCDTSEIFSLIKKSKKLNTNDPEKGLKLSFSILEKAKKCNDPYLMGKSFLQIGASYDYLSQIDSALSSYNRYLYYGTQAKDSGSIAEAYNMIGSIYIYKAD